MSPPSPPDPRHRVRPGGLVPKSRYLDPGFMQLEWERVWTRAWLMACREVDVAAVGDQFVFDIGPESILVVRESPQSLRAFYNVCMHRGTRLRTARCGRSAQMRCPYHGWSWRLDGKLDRIPDRESFPDIDPSALSLREVRCDVSMGFVWITMDPASPSLAEFLGEMPARLAPYRLDRHALVRDVTVEWDANWKLCIDNSDETYHVHAIHPQLLELLEDDVDDPRFEGPHSSFMVRMGTPSHRLADRSPLRDGLAGIVRKAGLDPAQLRGDALAARDALKRGWRERLRAASMDYPDLADDDLVDNYHGHIFPKRIGNPKDFSV